MGDIYGGHLVARYLKEVEEISTVFALSGGHIQRILDGFTEYEIRAIDVRHEQAAAMMAHAWSIYTRKPGVCLVTAGPGFTNALTGVVNAYLDNVPLIVLCGRSPLRDDIKGALQEMNQVDMVKPVVKWYGTCFETKRIPEYLATAFRHAVEGRPGPVFLELPPDILNSKIPEEIAHNPARGGKRFTVHPDDEALRKAADLINSAKKPILIGGSGLAFSACDENLQTFIEKAGMPFQLLNNGRGVLPDNHPQSMMDAVFTAMMMGLSQADVIIAAGIRFNWLLQFGEIFPNAKVVRIDIAPYEIDRNRSSDVGLVGDVGSVLGQILPLVEKREHIEWLTDLRKACHAFIDTELKQREKATDPIHPIRLVAQIQKVVGDDALYVVDGGDTSYFGLTGLQSKERSGVLVPSSSLLGCLGTGIPYGIAAKLARPDKIVVVLNGDGSFGFNAMEFDTAVRHDIPIVCVISNDCAWGMIKHGQEMMLGKERLQCSELGLRHYEKMVEGLGGHGEFVTKDEEIIPALERAIASNKPACVNVLTDPTVTSPATIMFEQGLKVE
ncbi:MAG: thiamine pyrophosphate-binding protein [Deltaproteobacteria bacterium]|nr:thiamine pyrophosphate-binding protein [Deltaproteobacteria bacterium]